MPEPTREEFLERRRQGIGGSDVAAILGLSKWKTPYQVWEDKTGRAPVKDETEFQHFGHALEQVVADEFELRTGKKVQRRNEMYKHKEHPELIANIDRYIIGGGILECKTSNAFATADWGETGTDDIPDYYMTQVQHYMHVTGYHDAALAVLIGGNQYRHYYIAYDKDLAEFQATKCCEFWNKYVQKDMPPPVTVNDDLARIFPGKLGEVKIADAEVLSKIEELRKVTAEYKEVYDLKSTLTDEIKLFCEDADTLTDGDGTILLTYKRSKDNTSTVTDWESICRSLCPEDWLTAELIATKTETITKPGIRRMILKNRKADK